jgi:hypothetical protein
MPAVIVNHRVADFDAWLKLFESHSPTRQAAGFFNTAVWQAAGDPTNVFIYMENNSLAAMQAFGASEDLQQRMAEGGVIGAPQIHALDAGRSYPH